MVRPKNVILFHMEKKVRAVAQSEATGRNEALDPGSPSHTAEQADTEVVPQHLHHPLGVFLALGRAGGDHLHVVAQPIEAGEYVFGLGAGRQVIVTVLGIVVGVIMHETPDGFLIHITGFLQNI